MLDFSLIRMLFLFYRPPQNSSLLPTLAHHLILVLWPLETDDGTHYEQETRYSAIDAVGNVAEAVCTMVEKGGAMAGMLVWFVHGLP